MGIHSVGQMAVLSGLTIAMGSLPGAAIDLHGRSLDPALIQLAQIQIAQIQIAQGEITCRQTNGVTGVYQQPDPLSLSQGVLPAGQTVRLEVVGTGTGWSRIREPIVGWVEARYLTPPTPCTVSGLTQPANPAQANLSQSTPAPQPQINPAQPAVARSQPNLTSDFPQPTLPPGRSQVTVPPLQAAAPQTALPQPPSLQNSGVAVRSTVPPVPAVVPRRATPNPGGLVSTVCDVLPPEGLVVRQQPNPNSAGNSILAPGTYNFQFTGATQVIGRQRLVYIVSPTRGWIQAVSPNGNPTLGGGRCG